MSATPAARTRADRAEALLAACESLEAGSDLRVTQRPGDGEWFADCTDASGAWREATAATIIGALLMIAVAR